MKAEALRHFAQAIDAIICKYNKHSGNSYCRPPSSVSVGLSHVKCKILTYFCNVIHPFTLFLGGLRVTNPTIRLVCPSVCPSVCLSVCPSVRPSVRQHFACKHDNSTNIRRIDPKLIPWMYLRSVLVKFEDGWPWPIFEVTGVNLNMTIFNFRL